MTRVQFNTTASASGAYTIPINPVELDLAYSQAKVVQEQLDGPVILNNFQYDSRPRSMKWLKIRSDYPGFQTMIQTLKGYQGSKRYVNFNDIDYNVPVLGWVRYIVEDVIVSIEPGGKLKYNVEVLLRKTN